MEKKRVLYYDLLNISACICVIALHQNDMVHSFSNDSHWKQALVIEVICYWATFIFLPCYWQRQFLFYINISPGIEFLSMANMRTAFKELFQDYHTEYTK